jgi:hypothetical protein
MLTDDAGRRWVIVHDEPNERVRRYPVPGGWLYQVEAITDYLESTPDPKVGRMHHTIGWHPPVFVPERTEPTDVRVVGGHMDVDVVNHPDVTAHEPR